MGLGILGWQLLILITIVVSGRSRAIAVIFWVIWTLVQVAALPLSVLQFGTIWLGYVISKALFPGHPSATSSKPLAPAPSPPKHVVRDDSSVGNSPTESEEQRAAELAKSRLVLKELLKQVPSGPPAQDTSATRFQKVLAEGPENAGVQRSATEAPDPGELSDSLVAYLESIGGAHPRRGSAHQETSAGLPSEQLGPNRARLSQDSNGEARRSGSMCERCPDERAETVSGLSYCSECGAYLRMKH